MTIFLFFEKTSPNQCFEKFHMSWWLELMPDSELISFVRVAESPCITYILYYIMHGCEVIPCKWDSNTKRVLLLFVTLLLLLLWNYCSWCVSYDSLFLIEFCSSSVSVFLVCDMCLCMCVCVLTFVVMRVLVQICASVDVYVYNCH